MKEFQNGEQVGCVTVIRKSAFNGTRDSLKWEVKCICGAIFELSHKKLMAGEVRVCGCLVPKTIIHGKSGTKSYRIWKSMISRCENPRHSGYRNYGGRGVRVCQRWMEFGNFYADMGEKPAGKTLDRFPDNDGNYEPSNCRWATRAEQARNKRTNRVITFDGKTCCLADSEEVFGVKPSLLAYRLNSGWPIDKAISLPPLPPLVRLIDVI